MGILDKVKVQAGQLAEKAQHGVAQGQAKIDALQARRALDALLRDLGMATYRADRHGGPRSDVDRLLGDVESHAREHGLLGVLSGEDPDQDEDGAVGDTMAWRACRSTWLAQQSRCASAPPTWSQARRAGAGRWAGADAARCVGRSQRRRPAGVAWLGGIRHGSSVGSAPGRRWRTAGRVLR